MSNQTTDVPCEWTALRMSQHAARTTNPIRAIVDKMKPTKVSDKPMLSLSIGDPAVAGNLRPPQAALTALVQSVEGCKNNGYPPAHGSIAAREAVATYWRNNFTSEANKGFITADRIVLGSGASHPILMTLTALCNEGDTVLLPKPGFSLYSTICQSYGIHVEYYPCLADKNWEIDLEALRSKILPGKTKAILINNPSNPCGSNFSREHLQEVLSVAEQCRIPIIADEIYSGMVWGDKPFTSVAQIDHCSVPLFVIGGTAKNYVVPGWRMGWVILVDRLNVATEILSGITSLSQLLVGPNSLIQSVLDSMLNHCEPEFSPTLNKTLQENAFAAYNIFHSKCQPLLKPTVPEGAMYMMVLINVGSFDETVSDGITFCKALLEEENVQVLPGEIFGCPNSFRVVYCKPLAQIEEASERIRSFCDRHRKK